MAASLAAHRSTWPMVDRFFALTPFMARFLIDEMGISQDQITIKPNSVPDHGPSPRLGTGLLFLGRLDEEKGVRLLLDAWNLSAPGEWGNLTIAGDGPLRDIVLRYSAKRPDVSYVGLVHSSEVDQLLTSSSAVVVPSLWPEPFPRVIVESLARARPVIVTDLGGMPSIVDEECGWVVRPSVDGLARGIRAATNDASALAEGARLRYEQRFSPEVVVKTLVNTYALVAAV